MSVYEIKHPVWGSNFSNQLCAEDAKNPGENGNGYVTVTKTGFFGREKQVREYVGDNLITATDTDFVKRYFHHKCELLKIIMMPRQYSPTFIVLLDGHIMTEFYSHEIETRVQPDDLAGNKGRPIAEIWFHGIGQRYGPLTNYGSSRLICTFSSQEQLDSYLSTSAGVSVSKH